MACAPPPKPHDLLWLKRVPRWPDAPDWVTLALARTPVVVVRRAGAPKGLVGVGVRGAQRNQRYGALISIAEIERCVSPEMLCPGAPHGAAAASCYALPPREWDCDPGLSPTRAGLPVFVALQGLEPVLRRFRLIWGPTGSAGFELATGVPTVQPSSDLDLLIRLPEWIGRDTGQSLLGVLSTHAAHAGVRIDAQLETPGGAVSLAEYAGSTRRVLLRSSGEPVMVDDPWAWGAASAGNADTNTGVGTGLAKHSRQHAPHAIQAGDAATSLAALHAAPGSETS